MQFQLLWESRSRNKVMRCCCRENNSACRLRTYGNAVAKHRFFNKRRSLSPHLGKTMKRARFWGAAAGSALFAILFFAIPVLSAEQTIQFNIPEQSATTGIPEFARQAGIQILAPETLVRGKGPAS